MFYYYYWPSANKKDDYDIIRYIRSILAIINILDVSSIIDGLLNVH